MKKKRIPNKQTKAGAHSTRSTISATSVSKKIKAILAIIIAAFAFVLYAQSISHDYTLDDHKVIDQNIVTTRGIAGISTILKTDYWYGSGHNELRGPIYRPTSLIIFALVWEGWPDNTHVYHFINVLLYAISCLLLFLLLCELFRQQTIILPFVCALLFTGHPIHTEVVNNIKSLDEILCFLFGIASTWFVLKYASTNSKWTLFMGGLVFFLSLISKETGISFLLIIPLTLFFFSGNFKRSIIPVSILLVVTTGLWLILRMMIFKDLTRNVITETSPLNNTLYAAPDFMSKYATAFYILLRYIVLLIFPHPLTCDYNYAQIKIRTFADLGALTGVIIYAGMGVYSILNLKRKHLIAFGIFLYLIFLAPVSNIFFLGGSSMAERFLYMPSLGFCLVLSYFLSKYTKTGATKMKYNNVIKFFSTNATLFVFVFAICFAYSLKIFSRNKDWKDTLTVFSRDIRVSKNSATANELLGNSLILQTARSSNKQHQLDTLNLAKQYLKKALEIAPGFFYASSNLGYVYLTENKADSAYLYLKEGLKFGPDDVQLNYYFGSALFLLRNYDEAIKVLTHTISLDPKNEETYIVLASSYLGKGDMENGLTSYYKLLQINPKNGKAYYYAAGVLRARGDTVKANEFMSKAASLGYKLQ
jgi:tetratricopeptide (TPR) repeat protein